MLVKDPHPITSILKNGCNIFWIIPVRVKVGVEILNQVLLKLEGPHHSVYNAGILPTLERIEQQLEVRHDM